MLINKSSIHESRGAMWRQSVLSLTILCCTGLGACEAGDTPASESGMPEAPAGMVDNTGGASVPEEAARSNAEEPQTPATEPGSDLPGTPVDEDAPETIEEEAAEDIDEPIVPEDSTDEPTPGGPGIDDDSPTEETVDPGEQVPCVSFDDDILPIIKAECAGCHSTVLSMGSLDLGSPATYLNLVEGISVVTNKPFVVPGSPEESYLMDKLSSTPTAGVKMPPEPDSLTTEEIALFSDWIAGGASLTCAPEAPEAPEPEGPVFDLDVSLTCEEAASGNLRVSLFEAYPSSSPPLMEETVDGVVFPVTVTVEGVPEGTYTVEAVLDRMPFDAQNVGPEDSVEIASINVPAVLSVELALGAPADDVAPGTPDEGETSDVCQECAPGLTCGADPAFPNYCAGDDGSCGEIDAAGVCLSDTLVAYCVGEGASAHLLSLDCTTNPKATACGEAAPGTFDCIVPSSTTVPEPTEEPGECGTCASGLECGQTDAFPAPQCSGDAGTCEGLDYAGTCVSGGILLYCSDDTGGGTPLSFDCSLNTELTTCGETTPGVYDCVAPGTVSPPAPEEEEPVTAFELFTQVHPIMEASCSGWLCHQYSGFAQPDLEAAYDVVQEKDFADNILDAIVEGRMPAGNFGLPLCTGDPSVDTDPKCLTQEQLDLVTAWVNLETGQVEPTPTDVPDGDADVPDSDIDVPEGDDTSDAQAVVTFTDVHPILKAGCSGFFCHSGGFAGDDIQAAFEAVESKSLCEPILEAVQDGSMPPGKGCTGDPTQDANISGCLGPEEHSLLIEWVLGSDTPCPAPE